MTAASVVQMVLQTEIRTANTPIALDIARLVAAFWRPSEVETSQFC